MPSINQLYEEYKPRGFEVVLVNMGEDEERVRLAAKTRGYRMPILLDSEAEVVWVYRVTATPTVFLITRGGLIAGRAIGMRDWAGSQGRAVLEALLAEQRKP